LSKNDLNMKKFLSSTTVQAIALMALIATAAPSTATALPSPGVGPLTVSWKVSQGPPYLENTATNTIIKKGTKIVGTNYITTFKSTVKTSSFDNAALLALLSHSFGTPFTNNGDALAISAENQVFVVNGTNVVMNVGAVVRVALSGTVDSGAGSYTETVEEAGTNGATKTTYKGSETQNASSYVTVTYNDTSMITDGTGSSFTFAGVSMTAFDATLNKTNGILSYTENFTLSDGAGTGSIRGTNSIITGNVTGGPIKGIEP
jgi:hypothetical protein